MIIDDDELPPVLIIYFPFIIIGMTLLLLSSIFFGNFCFQKIYILTRIMPYYIYELITILLV